MDVIPHTSVEEFFHEVVLDALERAQVEATEATECYLVSLLGAFAATRLPDEPLSLKLVQSQSDPAERIKALKEVGDTSLYLTGFFRSSLERQIVDASFYMNLGEAAYRELARRFSGASTVGEIYEELAAKFPRFVDVLVEVRNQVDFTGGDAIKLYEQWLVTRSEWVERRLRGMGLLVSSSSKRYLQ